MVKRRNSFIIALSLILILLFNVPIQAFASESDPVQGYEITESGTPIQEIDKLLDQRTEAILSNDEKLEEQLDESLNEQGLKRITKQEVMRISGQDLSAMTRASSNVKFETIDTTYTVGGVKYKVKRIYATPNGRSNIYKTGVTTLSNSKSASAVSMNIIKTTVSSAAGFASNTISAVQSVYAILSTAIDGLEKTSTINDIKATYTWNTAETCAFIYFLNPATDAYILKGRYSKASYGVGISIPTLKVDGRNVSASVKQKSYSGSATPKNYNNIYQAYLKFKNGGIHVAQVNTISIKGIENKTVKTINLTNPQEPAEII